MIYIASPYSHKNKPIVRARFNITEFCTAIWMFQGLHVYSPIVHCHALSAKYSMPTDAKYWERYNANTLRRCEQLFSLELPGWDKSLGMQAEFGMANMVHLTIETFNWDEVKCFFDNFGTKRCSKAQLEELAQSMACLDDPRNYQ